MRAEHVFIKALIRDLKFIDRSASKLFYFQYTSKHYLMKKIVLFLVFIFNMTIMAAQHQDPWSEYMTPSAVHELLAQYVGDFTMEITMGEGKEPSVIAVDSQHSLLMGGRFLQMVQHGVMMGMDYQALTTLGFNNTDKQFALTTITNMGTGTLSLFGDWDEQSKTATLFGPLTNPVTKHTINVKQIVTFLDKNTISIESFDQENDRPEKKTVSYKLIRK